MSDYFITQWGGLDVVLVAIIIFVTAVIVFGIIPQSIENNEIYQEQRELIPKLNCIELGDLILSDDIDDSRNAAFAEKHWHIRCE